MQLVLGKCTNLQLHATVAKPKISSNDIMYFLGFEQSFSCMSMACYEVPCMFLHHLGLCVTKMNFKTCCCSARNYEGILCTHWDLIELFTCRAMEYYDVPWIFL